MSAGIELAAGRLAAAIEGGPACAPVRDLLGTTDIDAAYQVQSLLGRRRVDAGATVIGRKIGLTSPAVQRQLGVARPDFGVLYDDMSYADGQPVPLGGFHAPRVEAEVAFVLSRDLDSPVASIVDVMRATEFVLAAIEIVDSRIAGWDITITDTVADNASSGAFVLGTVPHLLTGLDLAMVGMVLEHRGEPVSVGAGAACLGSPVTAVAWLARELAGRGAPLRAGEVVLSGALGPMVPVTEPGSYRAELDGLGSVRAHFVKEADQ